MVKSVKRKIISTIVFFFRNILRITCLIIIFHRFLFTKPAKCVDYEENINKQINVEGIKEIETDIIINQIPQVKKNGNIFSLFKPQQNNLIKEAIIIEKEFDKEKKELKELEKKYEQLSLSKEEKEKKLSEAKSSINKKKKFYLKKLDEIKFEAKKNIKQNLIANDLVITQLDENRDHGIPIAVWRDPQRYFLIYPIQTTLRSISIKEENFFILDMVIKILVLRLVLWWITYPQNENFNNEMQEIQKSQQNPYLTLEEKQELINNASKQMRYIFANLAFTFLFNFFTITHPFIFDRTNPKYGEKIPIFPWIILIFIVSCFSLTSFNFLQKKEFPNWHKVVKYWQKSWLSIIIMCLIFPFISLSISRFIRGTYLYYFIGEAINFLINMIRLVSHRRIHRKSKK